MAGHRSVIEQLHEMFNVRRIDDLDQVFAESVVMARAGETVRGLDAIRDYLAGVVLQMPGIRMELEGLLIEGSDAVVAQSLYTDTLPVGPQNPASGVWRLPATRLGVYRLSEGRIAEWRDYVDPDAEGGVTLASVTSARPGAVRLIGEQAALRRVATLVAGGARQSDVLDAIVAETAALFGTETWLVRYDADGSAFFLASARARSAPEPRRFIPTGDGTFAEVLRSRRPVRVDAYADLVGPGPNLARQQGVIATAAAPLIVQGRVWGALSLVTRSAPLAIGIEDRLAQFADLAATAIANAQSRADLQLLADEQAALRRVAELVARGVGQSDLFDAIVRQAAELFGQEIWLVRYDVDDSATALTYGGKAPGQEPYAPERGVPTKDSVLHRVRESARPARIDSYDGLVGHEDLPQLGITASAAAPLIVQGAPWGALGAVARGSPLPARIEDRLAQFADLAATAIANAQSRSELQSLAQEQAALRRVAELVARGIGQVDLFNAIVREAAELFGEEFWLHRFEPDGVAVVVAQHGAPPDRIAGHVPGNGPVLERVRGSRRPARVDSYTGLAAPARDDARRLGVIATAAAPLVVQGAVWGAVTTISRGPPLAAGIEDRLAQFADLAATAIANGQSRADLQLLADEQAALRRVAELVARGAATQDVFDQVTVEAARLLDDTAAVLMRYELSGASAEIVAQSSDRDGEACWPAGMVPTGTRIPVVGDIGIARVWRTKRVARVDDFRSVAGADAIPVLVDGAAVVMAPILVEDRLWGVLDAGSPRGALPAGTEDRLARFADLAATAIANTQSRMELQVLADEQAALRRVAVLVARGAATQGVFDAVTAEAHQLLDGSPTALWRVEPPDEMVIVAQVGSARPVGARLAAVIDDPGLGRVIRDRRPVRIDDLGDVLLPGRFPTQIRGAVGVPIATAGRMWGALVAYSPGEPLAAGTEERLGRFAELVAAAITDAESRAELMASRSRIVASADEARRRLARDVHDGAQQRLVHALITLKRARSVLSEADGAAARLLDESLAQAQSANEQLRELAQGILPAALARGGLRAGVKSLLEHISLPVDTKLLADRLPEPVETTAYFIIAEALTNVVKHAGADQAHVRAVAVGDQLQLEVTDNGRGGANPTGGSGLIGLADRVDAAGGSMSLTSPPDVGTRLSVTLPIPRPGRH